MGLIVVSVLAIGIEELLRGAVEGVRLEFKATWNPKAVGPQILKTLCAFANDLQNLNGGYIVIGVEEENGVAVRPVRGLEENILDEAQKWIRGQGNRIEPTYVPVMDTLVVDGRCVLVLWAPASDNRPHQAPDGETGQRKYWIRIGSETIEAKGDLRNRLIEQTARTPFDDRRAFNAVNADMRFSLVREFLHDVGSDLAEHADAETVYAAMHITRPMNGHTVPRNIGLLFFSDEPERWFRGARIEVVEFGDEAGTTIAEKVFAGPVHHQVRQCLTWLDGMTTRHLHKQSNVPETKGWVSYPHAALREAIVNGIYHRSYEDVVEPTKVYLYPNRVEVISYPGPVDGIELDHLQGKIPIPPVPARNRRIGEFLKELRLAESRGTGVPKIFRSMHENGSPAPTFDFDRSRTYFRVTLPAHPEYVALATLREYAYRKATEDDARALQMLREVWAAGQRSTSIAVALIRALAERGNLQSAREIVEDFPDPEAPAFARVLAVFATALLDAGKNTEATQVLDRMPELLSAQDAFEAAIAERRTGREERAHQYFQAAGELVSNDVRALHEFAQTKMQIAGKLFRAKRSGWRETRAKLLTEAETYLERVLQMDAPPIRHAFAWYDLGWVRRWLRRPHTDVMHAYERAVALAPTEKRFKHDLDRYRDQHRQ